jgi:septal ring factor EnvC (AmiA/AmiB activator)
VSVEFTRQEPGGEGFLAQFPSLCICGSQKGPIVDTFLDKPGYGRIYLCRVCVGRAARALGLVKGEEMERLTHAAEQLAQAEREIGERQDLLEKLTKSLAERDQKIQGQQAYIETLSADVTQMRHLAALAAAPLKDLVGV